MKEEEVLQIMKDVGALILDDHIVYTSGMHGSAYINKDAIYPHTKKTSRLCRALADHFKDGKAEVVLSPALGGIILSQWTAYHLTEMKGKEIPGVYAEKKEGGFILSRGYESIVSGRSVLVVEDVLTTGGSVSKVVDLVREEGGSVVGVGALFNRGGVSVKDVGGVPELFSLVNMKMDSWESEDCPLCKKGVPVNRKVGKGKEFLEH